MTKRIITYIIVYFMLQLFVTMVIGVGGMLVNGQKGFEMTGQQLVIVQSVFGLLCLLWFLWRKWTPVSPHFLQTRPYTVLAWAVVAALGTFIPSLWLQENVTFLPDLAGKHLLDMMGSRLGFFAIAVVTPFVEEVLFRGAILRELLDHQEELYGSEANGRGMWLAITVSALIFAGAHMNPAQLPHAFLIGLLLGWVYARTRSIVPGIIIHVVNNTAAYLLTAAYINTPDITLSQIFGGSQLHVWLSVLFSLCLLLPALFQLNQRMKK